MARVERRARGDEDLVAGGRPSCTVGRLRRDVQRRRVALCRRRPALVAPRAHRTLHFRRHRRPGEEARRVGRDEHRSLPQRQRRPNLEAAAQAQGSQRERRRDRAVEPPVRLRGHVRARPLPLVERRPDVEPARSPTDRHRDRDRRPSPPAPDALGRGRAATCCVRRTEASPTSSTRRSFRRPKALVVDPRNPRLQYMAAENSGIWRSRDGGANWTRDERHRRSLCHGRPRHRPEAPQGALHVRLGPRRPPGRRLPISRRRTLMDEHLRRA